MSYSSIIFDLDGTLLDTLQDIATTSNAVLAGYGYPLHAKEEYRHFVGDGLTTLMTRITPEGTGKPIIDECCARFIRLYAKNWKRNCAPYDGVVEMLRVLREKSFHLAVLSNKPHSFAAIFVDEFFPGNIFSQVYGERDGFAKKPDPGVALAIAEQLGSVPGETVFVGDTGVDMRTGKAAGMLTVGVTWGFRSITELKEHHADIIINSPMELLQYVVPAN